MPMLDARFIAPMQAMKSEVLRKAFIGRVLLTTSGPVVRFSGLLRQAYADWLVSRTTTLSQHWQRFFRFGRWKFPVELGKIFVS
jgi:hypothetical protein